MHSRTQSASLPARSTVPIGVQLARPLGAPRPPVSFAPGPPQEIVERYWRGGYFWLALSCGHAFCELSDKPGIEIDAIWRCPLCPVGDGSGSETACSDGEAPL
jgi:hypothetical protein